MRSIMMTFRCDGSTWKEVGLQHPVRVLCSQKTEMEVDVTINEHGEMIIDDRVPPGWSDHLEDERYDHIRESVRRNRVACPDCKMKDSKPY